MVSKVIEKAAAGQLTKHTVTHHWDESFLFAYKMYHSRETTLIKVENDVLCAIDNGQSVFLLVDLSAAFNTVVTTQLCCLDFESAMALEVTFSLGSDLTSCRASSMFNLKAANPLPSLWSLDRGVPQGSALGIFTLSGVHIAHCEDYQAPWSLVPPVCYV